MFMSAHAYDMPLRNNIVSNIALGVLLVGHPFVRSCVKLVDARKNV